MLNNTVIILPQYLASLILLGNICSANRDNLPFQMPALKLRLLAIILAGIALAPFLRLIFLLGFVVCWLLRDEKPEVRANHSKITIRLFDPL